jgi:hypothetical protein
MRQRHGHRAHLQHRHVGHRRLEALRHDDGHAVAGAHAQARQGVGQAIGLRLQLRVRVTGLAPRCSITATRSPAPGSAAQRAEQACAMLKWRGTSQRKPACMAAWWSPT